MTVGKLVDELNMKVLTGKVGLDKEVTGVYLCDLLSWVMANAKRGNVWITVQNHINIVAVALLAEISCIIIPEGIEVEEAVVKRAVQENLPVISTDLSAYDICWMLHDELKEKS